MQPQDFFAVVVRIVGLVSLVYLVGTSLMFMGAGMPWAVVLRFIVWALASIWMLRGAPQLVRFAYPNDR